MSEPLDTEQESIKTYFDKSDLMSCPKCLEAKKLGNKYYNQLAGISDRIAEHVCATDAPDFNVDNYQRKLNGLFTKFDKTQTEFLGILKGRCKCCCPQWMIDDYLKAWQK